jgi:hypothetical protein
MPIKNHEMIRIDSRLFKVCQGRYASGLIPNRRHATYSLKCYPGRTMSRRLWALPGSIRDRAQILLLISS